MVLNWTLEEYVEGQKSTSFGDCMTILVAGGDRDWVRTMSSTLMALGYRTLTAFCSDDALKMMTTAEISTAIVEGALEGEGLSLVQALASRAAQGGKALNSILAVTPPGPDTTVALVGSSVVYVVDKFCEPKQFDDLLKVMQPPPVDVQSIASLSKQMQLLSAEMQVLKCSLEQAIAKDPRPVAPPPREQRQIDADMVRKLARAEAARARVIGGKILGDPAWNILLDLLLASLEGRRVAVSSACIVTGVATTTALRLINRMISDGVLVRVPDEADGRRDYLQIEPDVEAALKGYLFDLTQL